MWYVSKLGGYTKCALQSAVCPEPQGAGGVVASFFQCRRSPKTRMTAAEPQVRMEIDRQMQ